jgi:RNA polymerase sigma factor (sigma-70 family)
LANGSNGNANGSNGNGLASGSNGNGLLTAGSRLRLRFAADDRLVTFIRRGDTAAFEALYERHSRELLSFCVYLLGSRQDAEDAVQTTFAAAYRALRTNERPVALRPWLFTIARNDCLSILRKRRPTAELNGEPALNGDPFRELELREEVRHALEGLLELPENQRAALVLAEMHGLSQAEVGAVLGVGAEKVKAYVYQARSQLISSRRARDADCVEIREELATARGAALLRRRLRGHVRACAGCRAYADGVARQRRHLGALLPWAPSLLLKTRALEHALAIRSPDPAVYARGAAVGGSLAGAAAEFAGGGLKALLTKAAAGVACVGASACVGATVLGTSILPEEGHSPAAAGAEPSRAGLLASARPLKSPSSLTPRPARARGSGAHARRIRAGAEANEQSASGAPQVSRTGHGGSAPPAGSEESPTADTAPARAYPAVIEHQLQGEERQRRGTEERLRRLTARQRKSESRQPRPAAHSPRKSKEQRQLEREERPEVGGSRPPRKGKEQRQLEREERRRERAEGKP